MAISTYAVAVGGNRRGRHGTPRAEVRAALALLGGTPSPIIDTPPLGPSIRRFANAVTVIASAEPPAALLARLKAVERAAGRRAGRRWGARVLDLDIVLWSGGRLATRPLTLPHPAFRTRAFVLRPLLAVAPGWRDPVTGLRVRHLHARLTRARPINRPRGTW
ncbi:MAG: 2-amino-4-hydroxy-6-hydroxymethyldihydropteridine diphosphokinase [Sphingomonas adhaesiva]|uniref:2-amino-4-hydroxy-6- hydroxymethyldihydropteridine diphosphokinase n=1 Tax=Sphingomonas adhaesiva TaxID=28212 RepID=UPI002FF5A30F